MWLLNSSNVVGDSINKYVLTILGAVFDKPVITMLLTGFVGACVALFNMPNIDRLYSIIIGAVSGLYVGLVCVCEMHIKKNKSKVAIQVVGGMITAFFYVWVFELEKVGLVAAMLLGIVSGYIGIRWVRHIN